MQAFSPLSFKHGSEEINAARGTASVSSPLVSLTEAVDPREDSLNPRWNAGRLIQYLQELGCDSTTIEIVAAARFSGLDWINNLSDASFGDPMSFLMDDLRITDSIRRRRILADVRALGSVKDTSPLGLDGRGSNQDLLSFGADELGLRPSDYLGRISDGAPLLPRGKNGQLLTSAQFQAYGIGIQSHASRASPLLASGINQIMLSSLAKVEDLMEFASPLDIKLDIKYGTNLYNGSDEIVKRELKKPNTRQYNGLPSCLQILSTLALKVDPINNKTTSVVLTKFLQESPCQLPGDLHERFMDMEDSVDQLSRHTGADAAGSKIMMRLVVAAADKSFEALINTPAYNDVIGTRVTAARYRYELEDDPEAYYNALSRIAEACKDMDKSSHLYQAPKRKAIMPPPFTPQPAGGVQPPAHTPKHKDPNPCFMVREGKRCLRQNCPLRHTGFTGIKCTDEQYVKTGMCSVFDKCNHRHPWDTQNGQLASKLQQSMPAKEKAFLGSLAMMMQPVDAADLHMCCGGTPAEAESNDICELQRSIGAHNWHNRPTSPTTDVASAALTMAHLSVGRHAAPKIDTLLQAAADLVVQSTIDQNSDLSDLSRDADVTDSSNSAMAPAEDDLSLTDSQSGDYAPSPMDTSEDFSSLSDGSSDCLTDSGDAASGVDSDQSDEKDEAQSGPPVPTVLNFEVPTDQICGSRGASGGTEVGATPNNSTMAMQPATSELPARTYQPQLMAPDTAAHSQRNPTILAPSANSPNVSYNATNRQLSTPSLMDILSTPGIQFAEPGTEREQVITALVNAGWTSDHATTWLNQQATAQLEMAMLIVQQAECTQEPMSMGASEMPTDSVPWVWLLLDSGTFDHLVGTGAMQYVQNIRKIKPIPVKTGGNVVWITEMGDLMLADRILINCYINPHSDMTLISTARLVKDDWEFGLTRAGLKITLPSSDVTVAFQRGNLHYIPVDLLARVHACAVAGDYDQDNYSSFTPEDQQRQFLMSMGMLCSGPDMQQSEQGSPSLSNSDLLQQPPIAESYDQVCFGTCSPEDQQLQFYLSMGATEHDCKTHHLFDPKCKICVESKMRDKSAFKGAATKERPLLTANLDCMISSQQDVNGTVTDLTMVLPDTNWIDVRPLGSKEAVATAAAFEKMKHRVEALSDPGGVTKIQRVQIDPGSEFRGAFETCAGRHNIVLTRGGVKEKSAGAYVEGAHSGLHPIASALAKTALANEDLAILLRGELRSHTGDVKLHTEKSSGLSAYEEQTNQTGISRKWRDDTPGWGWLTFGYLNKKKRRSKVWGSAVMGIFTGCMEQGHSRCSQNHTFYN